MSTSGSTVFQGRQNRGGQGPPQKLHYGAQLCALCATFGSVQVLQPPNLMLLPPSLLCYHCCNCYCYCYWTPIEATWIPESVAWLHMPFILGQATFTEHVRPSGNHVCV